MIEGFGYLYGGSGAQTIIRFDPGTGQAVTLPTTITGVTAMGRSSASIPGRGYLFGGAGPGDVPLDRIVRFVP